MNKKNSISNFFDRHYLYLGIMPFLLFVKGLLGYPFHVTLLDYTICICTLIIGTYLLFRIFNYLFKDAYKAAYLTFIILAVLTLNLDLYYVIIASYLGITSYLLGIVLFIGLCFYILKIKQLPIEINKFLNIFSIAFACIFLVNSQDSIRIFLATNTVSPKQENNNYNSSRNLPDIYILLMDGYANSNNLKKYWHFSNDFFLNSLRKKGFEIVDSSRSNYRATVKTVSSMLNMQYQKEDYGEEIKYLFKIANNSTVDTLLRNNYDIYNFSLFDFNNYPSTNRITIFPENSSLGYYFLLKSVLWFYIYRREGKEALLKPDLRDKNLHKQLIEVTHFKSSKPKFVYGHFFVSHPPFYLDSSLKVNKKVQDLSFYTGAEMEGFNNKDTTDNTSKNFRKDSLVMKLYLNHIKMANRYAYTLIDTILANSTKQPIILLMSDHGFRYVTGTTDREFRNERYGNLCAFYFPDKDYSKLSNSITPVNYMRLVLSKALNLPYKPLPNKSHLE